MRTTRSVTRRLQVAQELEAKTQTKPSRLTRSRGLTRTTTKVEITTSATGQGTHIRWVRPVKGGGSMTGVIHMVQDQETAVPGDATGSGSFVDGRFITPPPIRQATPAAPRKAVQRQERIGNPGLMGIGGMNFVINVPEEAGRNQIKKRVVEEYLQAEKSLTMQKAPQLPAHPMKPWDSFPLSNTFLHLEEESDDEQSSSSLASPFSGPPTSAPQRRMLGPHGTHLILPGTLDTIMEGDNYENAGAAPLPSYPSPDATMSSPQKTRGLGPCGTILVGRDGQAIVPGLRPGY